MKTFTFGNPDIDDNISFESDECIVIGGRPAMGKTVFALNLLIRDNINRACYLSINESENALNHKINTILNESQDRSKTLDHPISEVHFDVKYIDHPELIDIIEFIVENKSKYDYFVIDELTAIGKDTMPLFSSNKNYTHILRHLNALAKALNKNIILLSNIDRVVEENETHKFDYKYYGNQENCIDELLILHRPSYYVTPEELATLQQTKLIIAKSEKQTDLSEFNLTFDSKFFTFY